MPLAYCVHYIYINIIGVTGANDLGNWTTWGELGDSHYRNPILPADYSDLDIFHVGSDYCAISSTFQYSSGMVNLQSKDAVNWKIEGHAIQNFTQMSSNLSWQRMNRYGFSVWAGAIRYHDGMFWIYFGTAQEGYHDKGKRPCWPMVLAGVDIEASQIGRLLPFWDDNGKEYFVGTNFANGYQTWLFEMTSDG